MGTQGLRIPACNPVHQCRNLGGTELHQYPNSTSVCNMQSDNKSKNSFFSRLKSAFSTPTQCEEISLDGEYVLSKDCVKLPLNNCPLEIRLGDNGHVLHLLTEEFVGDPAGNPDKDLLIYNPQTYTANISGFVRISKGDHLILGHEDGYQQAMLDYPEAVAKRHLSISHEGDSLLLKDLLGNPGTRLLPLRGTDISFSDRRLANLKEILRIFGGPIRLLSPEEALQDLNKVNALLEKEPLRPTDWRGMPGGVVRLPKKMIPIIIGDLHAQMDNLLTLLSQNEFLEMMSEGKAAMVFLGDAVHSEIDGQMDQMESSLLMMDLILRLKLWHPQQIFYVRGNHDSFSEDIGKDGIPQGLLWAKALRDLRGEAYKQAMDRFYELLPYVAVSKSYVACHAAPPKGKVDMDMLIDIHKYPALIKDVTTNRLYRPNRPAGYTKGDVKRFRNALQLEGKAELFVGHTPLTRHDTLWSNVGGIEHHDVVFSGNTPWIGVYTRVNGQMIPLRYRSEAVLEKINALEDVSFHNELNH